MGASFCVVFEAEVPPYGMLGGDNPYLLQQQPLLDELASQNGLTPLGAFESYDPEDIADYLDELEDLDLPAAQWFDAPDGLAAVRALRAYLDTHSNVIAEQAEVLTELARIDAELADAARARVRFRFAVVP